MQLFSKSLDWSFWKSTGVGGNEQRRRELSHKEVAHANFNAMPEILLTSNYSPSAAGTPIEAEVSAAFVLEKSRLIFPFRSHRRISAVHRVTSKFPGIWRRRCTHMLCWDISIQEVCRILTYLLADLMASQKVCTCSNKRTGGLIMAIEQEVIACYLS